MSTPNDKTLPNKPKSHSLALARLLSVIGIIALVVGFIGLFGRYHATSGEAKLPNPDAVVTSDQKPSEQKPNLNSYTVPANQPRNISIPSSNISGLIQKIGLTSQAALAVPTNVNFAGWYIDSALPGQPGLSVIDGHVTGQYTNGIFFNLRSVAIGSTIQVEFGNHSVKKFTVIAEKLLPTAQAAAFLFTKDKNITSQLNLVTCDGWDWGTSTYQDRLVVVSKLI